jgi:hypothetical protein
MAKTENEMYDVSKYSENELYGILDLTGNPTDRELEAKILFLIKKYDTIQNESGKKLAKFFRDIFYHFFDENEDEKEDPLEYYDNTTETYTDLKTEYANLKVNTIGNTIGNKIVSRDNTNIVSVGNEITGNIPKPNLIQTVNENEVANQLSTIVKDLQSNPQNQNNVGLTGILDYTKDTLNPLLKQTVKRIISIDSQYREDHRTLSTDFTFNLSDPLKDVVSLKLYSIQIPYTWWTINANYGSNLIYIKGNSPGINTGDFDIPVSITAGNYEQNELVSAINESLKTALLTQPDVSFGTTKITYNSNNSLCTFNIDIKKTYTESSYKLYFPYWTSPSERLHSSIPSFLGFNYDTYYPFTIKSEATLDSTTNDSASINGSDYTNAIYYIDNTNNYFKIVKYIGPEDYSSTSVIDTSYQVYFSNNLLGISTRNQILIDLSNQLAKNIYLSDSSIVRTNVQDTSNSCYSLKIKLNRNTTQPTNDIRYAIVFPDETSILQNTSHKAIWTGSRSCFCFNNLINQPNNILSEYQPVSDLSKNIYFSSTLTVYLKCITSEFTNIVPINDYSFNIVPITQGYSYSDFITQINNSITQVNNSTKNTRNKTGDFNINNTLAFIDENSQINLKFDINKSFNQDLYVLDLTKSFLHETMKLNQQYQDLSSTNVFTSSFSVQSSYNLSLTPDGIVLSNSLFTINPNGIFRGGNINEIPYSVPIPSINSFSDSAGNYGSYQNLQNAINQQFSNFTYKGERPLQGTNILLTYNSTTNKIDCTFTVIIQRIITDKDYSIKLIDQSADINTPITSIWNNQLQFDASYLDFYPLSNLLVNGTSYSIVRSNPIIFNSINITNLNNKFYFKPIDSGVTDSNNENDIEVVIPNGNYKRTTLIDTINNKLNLNAITIGSLISILKINNVEYIKFHIIINKIYTAKDYNLVFYDPFSFVKCFSGISSVRNTTWDSTLGWTLGFRTATLYNLSQTSSDYNIYIDPVTNIATIYGDTTVSTNLYNYFLICIDDYNLNHLNDGLVTITNKDNDIPLPSYSILSNYTCDPVTGKKVYNNSISTTTFNSLTQNQVYSLTQIANNQRNSNANDNTNNISKSISTGPFVKDVFGIIPMKTSGMKNGSVYVDFSGTLQNQERTYFGPVNIHRMSVKLVTDRGDVVDLNGSNWSFSLLCEQLYQQKPGNPNAESKSSS